MAEIQKIPTGWARVYAILSLRDGLCYGTNKVLDRCILRKGHEGECMFSELAKEAVE